jgi:hypothetical protein
MSNTHQAITARKKTIREEAEAEKMEADIAAGEVRRERISGE